MIDVNTLKDCTVKQLRATIATNGYEGCPAKATKAQLIEFITEQESANMAKGKEAQTDEVVEESTQEAPVAETTSPEQEAFNAAVAQGLNKDDVVMAIYNAQEAGKKSISSALKLYTKFGKGAGIIKSNEEVKAEAQAALANFVTDGTMDYDAARKHLTQQMGMSGATARKHMVAYCAANDLTEPPKNAPAKKATDEQLGARMAELTTADPNTTREQLEADLINTFGYTEKSVKGAYRRGAVHNGWATKGESGSVGAEALGKWAAVPGNLDGTRKEIMARIKDHFKLKDSTVAFRWSSIQTALAYHEAMSKQAQQAAA